MMKELMAALQNGTESFDKATEIDRTVAFRYSMYPHIDVLYVVEGYTRNNPEVMLGRPDVLGYLVGGKVYGTKYPYSMYAEQSKDPAVLDFFGGSLTEAEERLKERVSAKLFDKLHELETEGLLVSSDEALENAASAAKSTTLRDAIIAKKRPTHSEMKPKVSLMDTLQFIADEADGSTTTVDALVAAKEDSKWFSEIRSCYAYETSLMDAYDAKMGNLTLQERLAQSISDAFEKAKDAGAKSVAMELVGRDDNIPAYVKAHFPEFHIDNTVVKGKYETDRPWFESTQLGSSYAFAPNKPLKERYGNRNQNFLDKILYADIIRISYKGKVLYENKALVEETKRFAVR